ncbi:MAG: type II toxin-antitoxin system RelE/ParE family toxin [Planctomycetes bacterium]|nr:type II toxin-antitoxin system RelE/ParE family toxin [Planctomycetota bacterium]
MDQEQQPKPVFWIRTSKRDLKALPGEVRRAMGYAIWVAQLGDKHPDAKPLKGFGGAGVLEVVEDFDRSTYRTVYTVKFAGAVYVLHAFQKKSKTGSKTPASAIELVRKRLKEAGEHYAKWHASQAKNGNKA